MRFSECDPEQAAHRVAGDVDEGVQAVFRAIMAPPFFDALKGETRSTEQAGALIAEAIAPWLRALTLASTADLPNSQAHEATIGVGSETRG